LIGKNVIVAFDFKTGFLNNKNTGFRVPYANAGRQTSFIVFLVYYNGSVPLGAVSEALRAL